MPQVQEKWPSNRRNFLWNDLHNIWCWYFRMFKKQWLPYLYLIQPNNFFLKKIIFALATLSIIQQSVRPIHFAIGMEIPLACLPVFLHVIKFFPNRNALVLQTKSKLFHALGVNPVRNAWKQAYFQNALFVMKKTRFVFTTFHSFHS